VKGRRRKTWLWTGGRGWTRCSAMRVNEWMGSLLISATGDLEKENPGEEGIDYL
jgi:hypothetical protein